MRYEEDKAFVFERTMCYRILREWRLLCIQSYWFIPCNVRLWCVWVDPNSS